MSYVKTYTLPKRLYNRTVTTASDGTYNEDMSESTNSSHGLVGTYGENPRWRDDLRDGLQAATHMDVSITDCTIGTYQTLSAYNPPGEFWSHVESDGKWIPSLDWDSAPPFLGSTSEVSANNEALSRLVSAIDREYSAIQAGVIAGEFTKTVKLLRSPLRSLFGAVKNYQKTAKGRLKRTKPKRRQAVVENTWLEASFGWSPLVRDLDDTMKYLATINNNHDRLPRKVVKVFGSSKVAGIERDLEGRSGGAYFQTRKQRKKSGSISVAYQAMIRTPQPGFSTRTDLGLTLDRFLPTVWELIPYSFLVDYFTNVGSIVEAASTSRSKVVWITKWIVYQNSYTEHEYSVPTLISHPYKYGFASVSPASRFEKRYIRAPYTGSLVPDFEFRVPGMTMQWLNVGALTARAF